MHTPEIAAKSKALCKAARSLLPRLAVGDAVVFDLPLEEPARRILYQVVNGVAFSVIGPRGYKISGFPGGVSVLRKAKPRGGLTDGR